MRKLYDPQLTPERDITKIMDTKFKSMLGTKKIVRGPTEQYMMTCTCGARRITSDNNASVYWMRDHSICEGDFKPHIDSTY